jgi:hypothetical protein
MPNGLVHKQRYPDPKLLASASNQMNQKQVSTCLLATATALLSLPLASQGGELKPFSVKIQRP